MPAPVWARNRRRTGIVLILVLIVIVVLALAAYTFNDSMMLERRAALHAGRRIQARLCAESGIAYVESVIQNRHVNPHEQLQDDPERFRGVEIQPLDGVAKNFSIIAPVDGTEPRYGLVNLSGRLNLNSLVVYEANAARHALLQLPGMSPEIADAILDWIDEDDQPREYGVESGYYESLSPGYRCGNGPLRSLDELLLVRDVTFVALYGRDRDRNGRIDDAESALSAESHAGSVDDSDRWSQWLTTESGESNLRTDGQQRIDLNGSDLASLFDTLESEFGVDVAKLIVGYRLYGPFQQQPSSQPATRRAPPPTGVRAAVIREGMVLNLGPRYTIRSVFEVIGITIGYADTTGELIQSPWSPNTDDEQLAAFERAVTMTTGRYVVGRINFLHASRPVLAGVPGMNEATIEQILEFREETEAAGATPTLTQLSTSLDLETMREIAPFLTTGGDVYAGQVIGQIEGRSYCRLEFTIDATGPVPWLKTCRDLTSLGRGL